MSVVRSRQAPLKAAFRERPQEALTRKWAATSAREVPVTDPFHGEVEVGAGYGTLVRYGIDHAVGGLHDQPNPGDLLCAALAACADATIRMAAEAFGVTLEDLTVEVTSDWDARGALGVNREVRVGLQALECRISLTAAPDTDPRLLDKIISAGERYCVILDTLRGGVDVTVAGGATVATLNTVAPRP
jgi:uncharacterized OsmC-like protein